MKTELLIIGGGPAGYTLALQCARQGKKPVLVEKDALGGTGLRWGCLPVKYLMDRIRIYQDRQEPLNGGPARRFPLQRELARELLADCRSTMAEVSRKMEAELLDAGVTVLYGSPELKSPRHLSLKGDRIDFDTLILATGTEASPPPGVIVDGTRILTHREAVCLTEPPESLVILGGDVEGLEFASLFSELGTKVTVLEMLPRLLAGMDEDLTEPLFQRLEANGVQLHPGSAVAAAESVEGGVQVETADGRQIRAVHALVAMARRPVVPEGFENTGLSLGSGRIVVDDNCQTAQPHIYCIGDLNGRMEMAHTAMQQGILLADHLVKGTPVSWEYGPLPRAMFTLPQNGGAGFQEKELQARKIPYRKARVTWRDTWRGAGQADPDGFLKVLVGEDDLLLGVWMTGAEISEQVGSLGLLLNRKIRLEELKRELWVHPTLSEALLQAILKLT